MQNNSYLQWE